MFIIGLYHFLEKNLQNYFLKASPEIINGRPLTSLSHSGSILQLTLGTVFYVFWIFRIVFRVFRIG